MFALGKPSRLQIQLCPCRTRRFSEVLTGRDPIMLKRGPGSLPRYQAPVGAESRSGRKSFCKRIRLAGVIAWSCVMPVVSTAFRVSRFRCDDFLDGNQFNIHGLSGLQVTPLTHLLLSLHALTHFSLSEVDLCCSLQRRRHELSANTHALHVWAGDGGDGAVLPVCAKATI